MSRQYIDILFDGPPSPECGHFVETEYPAGTSVGGRGFEWIERDGMWALRITPEAFGEPIPSINSRTEDNDTSVQAGKRKAVPDVRRFKATSQAARLLLLFRERPMTDHEATNEMFPEGVAITQFEGCRRRCSDLRKAGFLIDSGDRRKNYGSPDDSIVWRLTEQGAQALVDLQRTGWSWPHVSSLVTRKLA